VEGVEMEFLNCCVVTIGDKLYVSHVDGDGHVTIAILSEAEDDNDFKVRLSPEELMALLTVASNAMVKVLERNSIRWSSESGSTEGFSN